MDSTFFFAQRCSLLVTHPNGYTEYIHKDEEFTPVCSESLTSPGLELEIVTNFSHTRALDNI